jgi:hypothetical protein
MRLSSAKLKQIIKEELENQLEEVRTLPDLEGYPEDFKFKINSLIASGDIDQAQSLLDALGADPNYIKNYFEYQNVGDMEKMGAKAAGLGQRWQHDKARREAEKMADQKADEMHPDLESHKPFEDQNDFDRWSGTRDAHMDRYHRAYWDKMDGRDRLKESMYEGDDSILEHFHGATLEEGGNVCGACLFEQLQEASCGCPDLMGEAEYQGRKVTLNKPMRGDVKKFKVYVKDPKTGNVKKVNFGDPNMKIKKSNPKRRKSFRARHNCDNPGPKTKARYWSCKKW